MTKNFKYLIPTFAIIFSIFVAGCEDAPPNSYLQAYVVQGVLIVDEPIQGIIVQKALPTTDSFSMSKAIVKDADVRITDDEGRERILHFHEGGSVFGDYALDDTTVKVKPNALYTLSVRSKEGDLLTGKTYTPNRFDWEAAPRSVLQFPKDTLELPSPDSLKISWTGTSGTEEYLIRIKCMDTVGYGKYLSPPTDELNRRRKRMFDRERNPLTYNLAEYGYIQNTEVNTVWNAFKWYGRNSVAVLAADANLIRWYKLYFKGNNQYDPYLGSINGGAGMFGSASQVTKETFVLKNQP